MHIDERAPSDAASSTSPDATKDFLRVIDLVSGADDAAIDAALQEIPGLTDAWERVRTSIDGRRGYLHWAIDTAFNRSSSRRTRGRLIGNTAYRHRIGSVMGSPYPLELAVAIGELRRLMRLDESRLAAEAMRDVPPHIEEAVREEPALVATFPVLECFDELMRQMARTNAAAQGSLPLEWIVSMIRDLESLQQRLFPGKVKSKSNSKLASYCLGTSMLPLQGERFAGDRFLAPADLPDALQAVHDQAWHTSARTKTATGGFVSGLRERAEKRGSEELLVVLSASSDGRNRAIGGIAPRTPEAVWEKLIYDNSLEVLESVVQNEAHFNDERAYAMLDTGLGPQTRAVMSHGRVHMGIRVLAAERAIRHPQVDPMAIYRFLGQHSTNADVPHALWRDLVLEQQKRISLVDAKLEMVESDPLASEKQLEEARRNATVVHDCAQRLTTGFMRDVLLPYGKAMDEAKKAAARNNGVTPTWAKQRLAQSVRFVGSADLLRDPALLNLMVAGAHTSSRLVELLSIIVQAELPITPQLLIAVFQNPDPEVRMVGLQLMPNTSPDDIPRIAAELEERVRKDYETVREEVMTSVIPDYREIKGVAREISRMHHEFEACKLLGRDELVEIFVSCAERDPRAIPDTFRAQVREKQKRDRFEALLGSVSQDEIQSAESQEISDDDGVWDIAPEQGTVVQAEMFAGMTGSSITAPTKSRRR